MQGKGVIKFFAILLAVVCLYQLSFTWVAYKVRKDAEKYAKGDTTKEKAYLDSIATQPVYPLLKHTYQYCQARELALGLDLKGGMNVTMQISLRELVKSLANNNPDVVFNQALANAENDQKTSQQDYITLFVNEYEKLNPNGKLAALFATKDNQDQLKYNASNSEVETFLKNQADVKVQQSYTVLSTRIDQFGVTQPNISLQKGTNRILIELPGVKEPERVRKLLQGTAKLEFYKTYDNAEVAQILQRVSTIISGTVKSTADTAKSKTDTTKAKTLTTTQKDSAKKQSALSLLSKVKKSVLDSGSVKGKKAVNDENNLFSKNALIPNLAQTQSGIVPVPGPIVGFAAINDTARVNKLLSLPQVKSAMPADLRFFWGVKPISAEENKRFGDNIKRFELFGIKLSGADNGPVLTGDVVNDARSDVDQIKGGYEVTMYMNTQGAQRWRTITAEASASATDKKAIAIVLDNNVYSAPTVQGEIAGGVSSISGNFTLDDTKDLANVLKAGRLPAPAHIVSEAIVGPSLGQQAISDSLLSCVIGFLVVLVFMVAYYNRAGTVAVVAVLINVFFLMGVLTSLGAVLTVPGVAGIVLTLGIAVDANVLIYERVREEMAGGKSLRLSISDGFKHALSSILDSNISTLLTGIILLVFGSGPIQGFATTLIIGIVTSLFCSLLISRVIFEWMIEKGWDIKFSNPWSSHTFKNANYAFVKNRFRFYAFSGIFIVAGLISIALRGFNYGVDFQGGRVYVVNFAGKSEDPEKVRVAVDKYFGKGKAVIKTYGTDKISISTNYMIDSTSTTADAKVLATLKQGLNEVSPNYTIPSQEKVDSTIADGLKKSAVWTVIFTIIIISAYILIRFRKWQFSLGAMIATAHDALMVLAFFSLFKDALPFSLDIDQAFIAAILTVIGYSINDTVVVFDRIREFLDLHHAKTDEPKDVINQAINKTLSRTIITALTVLFVLIVLFIFGGDVIRGFSFALLIGVCFGTYSSICIATPVIIDFGKKDLR